MMVQQELKIKKYYGITLRGTQWQPIVITVNLRLGVLAQMVERPLSMRDRYTDSPQDYFLLSQNKKILPCPKCICSLLFCFHY